MARHSPMTRSLIASKSGRLSPLINTSHFSMFGLYSHVSYKIFI